MPILGPQCARDGKTVCSRISEARLPINSDATLTVVFGWASEERKAQGLPPSFQGLALGTTPVDYCPFCAGRIPGNALAVRSGKSAPVAQVKAPVQAAAAAAAAPVAPASATVNAAPASAPGAVTQLKVIRERLGLSQSALGESLGLARSSVANYENGRSPLSRRVRSWIAANETKGGDSTRPRRSSTAA